MFLKKNLTEKSTVNKQNNLLQQSCPPNWKTKLQNIDIEDDDESLHHNVIEDSFIINNEIPRVKNILKIGTPSARAFTVFTYSP
jgi:hypothetical protein